MHTPPRHRIIFHIQHISDQCVLCFSATSLVTRIQLSFKIVAKLVDRKASIVLLDKSKLGMFLYSTHRHIPSVSFRKSSTQQL